MSGAAALATRYRPGADADATQPVHLVPLPVRTAVGAVGAFCGTLLSLPKLEAVESGQGVPCSMCVRQHSATTHAPRSETDYSSLDWPVQLHGDQLVLPLGHCATAHIVPMDLVAAITPILAALDRPVPVLIHPDAPGCGLVIAGEPYGVPLPWPATVQVVTGMLPLPPSQTPHGPVHWYQHQPHHPLATCREIDVFSAMRTAGPAAHEQSGTHRAR
ncbi:MAG: hypothetical protein M3332_17975 [Actinomycetota bacterium]|nr:hypothetical protein [Actinomycetota bacterium]